MNKLKLLFIIVGVSASVIAVLLNADADTFIVKKLFTIASTVITF